MLFLLIGEFKISFNGWKGNLLIDDVLVFDFLSISFLLVLWDCLSFISIFDSFLLETLFNWLFDIGDLRSLGLEVVNEGFCKIFPCWFSCIESFGVCINNSFLVCFSRFDIDFDIFVFSFVVVKIVLGIKYFYY